MSTSDLEVRVRAPSRLHFGLLAFGDAAPRQFGGVGLMIERPETEVLVRLGQSHDGGHKPQRRTEQRAREFADRFLQSLQSMDPPIHLPAVELRVEHAAPEHMGLGSGTQLAMAVARSIAAFAAKSDLPPQDLARRVGRGRRSAIGVHGFNSGGFIVEAGKHEPDDISPLVARLNFPTDWHCVLIMPSDSAGLHGAAERDAFEGLAPIADAVTADLCRLTLLGMLPAIAERDFESFSDALFEFGQKVGQCFAAVQGGVYASPMSPRIVEYLHREGIRGIAQSSWGPTLCAFTDSRFRAEWLAARLADAFGPDGAETICTPANNLGAKVEVVRKGA